ncbi:Non-specific serine/threonine protein kinase [Purpureocillium takamizusanense]|uniref:non-specific serine/threonine protein kinase n=1 Tax=Purpureocillium takamizusanense TaxID=2060973 RepID=A0A9Q8V9H0_9HYPO|nr:Non-specific serine/threonine protein kinase [Purpureocillium takamizusanense]UNI16686.1 Non-specific serine/threonine protein kinase [Purpureocillium takamizusanense]
MENTDLIARVYAVPHDQRRAWYALKASSRYIAPTNYKEEDCVEYGRHSRAATELPEENSVPAHLNRPRLDIKFSDIPRTKHGIVFGCDPNSDVVLPNLKGLSRYHFSFTFDDANRLIVRDWGSLMGTEVTYDDQGYGTRSDFRWIVGGDPNAEDKTCITITVHQTVRFQIIAVPHHVSSTEYLHNVQRFRQGTASAEDLFRDLDLPHQPDTELPTGTHTPSRRDIHLRKQLGRGSFGTVTHFWNVSDGSEYALKEPTAKAIRLKQSNKIAWRDVERGWKQEANIMAGLSHPNIVRLLFADFDVYPRLYLEYIPGGTLESYGDFSIVECASVLSQCLSALKYLHARDPPLAHRDIQPGNILVQLRSPDLIEVKFGDFGLSKDNGELLTICGSHKYLAPEIYKIQERVNAGGREKMTYTVAVDVWSLGVVVYQMMSALPHYKSHYQSDWCEKIANKLARDLSRRPDELQGFLLDAMVVLSPAKRRSARECYDRLLLLGIIAQVGKAANRPTLEGVQVTLHR